jgi:hypothetical protein
MEQGTNGRSMGKRPPRPGLDLGSTLAGYTMALMLGMRVAMPLMRSGGPALRHGVLLLALVAIPAGFGVQFWRRRREERELQNARHALVRRRASRQRSSETVSDGSEPGPDAS